VLYFTITWSAVSQLIAVQFGTRLELTYVINNFAKFGVDRSRGWGLMSSQILVLPLLRSRP